MPLSRSTYPHHLYLLPTPYTTPPSRMIERELLACEGERFNSKLVRTGCEDSIFSQTKRNLAPKACRHKRGGASEPSNARERCTVVLLLPSSAPDAKAAQAIRILSLTPTGEYPLTHFTTSDEFSKYFFCHSVGISYVHDVATSLLGSFRPPTLLSPLHATTHATVKSAQKAELINVQ